MKKYPSWLWMGCAFFAMLLASCDRTQLVSRGSVMDESHDAVSEGAVANLQSNGERFVLRQTEAETAAHVGILPSSALSVLSLEDALKHGEYVWNDRNVPAGPIHIWVDLRRQLISVFRGGHEIGTAVIVYGATENETPLGVFSVLSKHRHYRSRSYDADMPHSLFITRDGVALHGSVMHPRHATHGCIGLPEEFSRYLFEAAEVGAVVEITRSKPAMVESLVSAANPNLH